MSLSLHRRLFAAAAIILVATGLTFAVLSSQRAVASHVRAAEYYGSNGQAAVQFFVSEDGTQIPSFTFATSACGNPPPLEVGFAIDTQTTGHPFGGTNAGGGSALNWELTITGSFSSGGNASGTWHLDLEILFIPCSASGTWTAATPDTDGDGCFDAQENGLDEELGGRRNPLNFWDFFDVWTHPFGNPTGWERNRTIDLFNDIFGVANRYGAQGTVPSTEAARVAAALTPPTSDTGYHIDFDRSPPPPGGDVWDMGPPNGTIDLFTDIFGVAAQYGHHCT